MASESVDLYSLLKRRSLLFCPEPRLGWTFQDRRAAYTPFTAPQPQPEGLPSYLERQITATERISRQRLTRVLPVSIIAATAFVLISGYAPGEFSLTIMSISLEFVVAASVCLVCGAGLTFIAVTARRRARETLRLARRQAENAHEEATRDWRARRWQHETHERAAADARAEWGAVPRPFRARRLDVFGGTLWSWEALLSTYGASALAIGPLLVIDLSREVVCGELARLARAAEVLVDTQLLPSQLATSTLLSDLGTRELVDAIVESMYGGTPEASRTERSMDDRILTSVCDALGDEVSLARIGAALRALMGEPDESTALNRDERRLIANELFSVEYRRQAHASISRIESYIHPIEQLGECAGLPGYLTCVALDSQARNVRSELLTDLIVQWLTHRVVTSDAPRPSVVVAGADELARRHLDRLSDALRASRSPAHLAVPTPA